jgi:hypothetical protein
MATPKKHMPKRYGNAGAPTLVLWQCGHTAYDPDRQSLGSGEHQ